jgi:hypothetical protein
MKNNCDRRAFARDVERFLNSKFAKNLSVLVDNRVVDLGFKIPASKGVFHTSTDECLDLLKANNKKFICLTIGTSYWFPSIGDSHWIHYTEGQFQYPALQRYKDLFLAEIHCYCCNWFEGRPAIEHYYRISVYEINGLCKTKTRQMRFENGNEINENNLKPGEDLEDEVLSINNFGGPGEYDEALNAEGRGLGGTTVKWGISQAMKKYGLWVDKSNKADR